MMPEGWDPDHDDLIHVVVIDVGVAASNAPLGGDGEIAPCADLGVQQ
jgi:hypothetical protein